MWDGFLVGGGGWIMWGCACRRAYVREMDGRVCVRPWWKRAERLERTASAALVEAAFLFVRAGFRFVALEPLLPASCLTFLFRPWSVSLLASRRLLGFGFARSFPMR